MTSLKAPQGPFYLPIFLVVTSCPGFNYHACAEDFQICISGMYHSNYTLFYIFMDASQLPKVSSYFSLPNLLIPLYYVRIQCCYLSVSQARIVRVILDIPHSLTLAIFNQSPNSIHFTSLHVPNPPSSLHIPATWLAQTSITSCLNSVLTSLHREIHPPHCS